MAHDALRFAKGRVDPWFHFKSVVDGLPPLLCTSLPLELLRRIQQLELNLQRSMLSVTDAAAIGNLMADHRTADESLLLGHPCGVDYHTIVKGRPSIQQCPVVPRMITWSMYQSQLQLSCTPATCMDGMMRGTNNTTGCLQTCS
jgi:hypothetical protein